MDAKGRLQLIARLTKLGDVSALAKEAGIEVGTAQKHKDRGSIPAKKVPLYQAAAERHGVIVTSEWLQWGRGPAPKPPPENFVPRSVSKIPDGSPTSSAEKDDAFRVPLWQVSDNRRGTGEAVATLVEAGENILAPQALREFKRAFAVRMWDSSNGPYLPRGTILYVERPHDGSPGRLCLFAHSHTDGEVIRPVVGILDSEDDLAWHVTQHAKKLTLPKDEYGVCWRIRTTRQD